MDIMEKNMTTFPVIVGSLPPRQIVLYEGGPYCVTDICAGIGMVQLGAVEFFDDRWIASSNNQKNPAVPADTLVELYP